MEIRLSRAISPALMLTGLLCIQLGLIGPNAASAATISTIAGGITRNPTANGGGSYDTTINSRTTGVDHLVASFTKTYNLTVGSVSFDYDLTWTGGGGNLHNFGSPTNSYGIDNGGGADNNALDDSGPNAESISFSVGNIQQTAGLPTAISFDGFTSLGVFFSTNVSDAGAITDGSSDIWTFDGALGVNPGSNGDPPGAKILGNSSDDNAFSWFGIRQHTHAQVDVSGTLPQTMVYEVRSPSNVSEPNRVRLNNIGVQFTVVPEPVSGVLLVLALLATSQTRWREE